MRRFFRENYVKKFDTLKQKWKKTFSFPNNDYFCAQNNHNEANNCLYNILFNRNLYLFTEYYKKSSSCGDPSGN